MTKFEKFYDNKIIEWREDRQWRKEHPDEAAYD